MPLPVIITIGITAGAIAPTSTALAVPQPAWAALAVAGGRAFFGSPVRNLWLARNWLRFPHTQAAAGTAAVWPNAHHVAPVVAVNGDGTVTVADSWATHSVRMAGLTFVNPHGGSYEGPVYAERSQRRPVRQEAYFQRYRYAGATSTARIITDVQSRGRAIRGIAGSG